MPPRMTRKAMARSANIALQGPIGAILFEIHAVSSGASTLRPWRALRPRRSWRSNVQAGHAHQIAGSHHVLTSGMRALDSAISALAKAAGGLAPTEELFDFPSAALAQRVGLGMDFHAEYLSACLRRRMRHYVQFAQ